MILFQKCHNFLFLGQRNQGADLQDQRIARRALADLNDLEKILLDSDMGENDDDEYNDDIEDYDPLLSPQKNWRRRNNFLGHMARMNFRRGNQRSSYRVGNDIRPGR